ncbi:hypothetical protein BGP_5817 [Beggiatoa sp. PS]|nr:hypothetical protein BGP_5817 [Beggiatoa sp. PS]
MTAHFKSIVVDYDALIIYLIESSRDFDRKKIEALLSVAIGSRLIFRDKQNRLRFQHHRFQEYFTALYIKVFKPELNWEQLYDNIWWQEVLVLLFGISDDPNELMRGLLDSVPEPDAENPPDETEQEEILERLILAARCMGNSLVPLEQVLFDQLLRQQLEFYMDYGNRLIVVKTIKALGYMKEYLNILSFVQFFLMHESPWVQNEAIELIARY